MTDNAKLQELAARLELIVRELKADAEPPPDQADDQPDPAPWPLGGYAPGMYEQVCHGCQKRHMADKRATRCLECAVVNVKKLLANPSHQPDVFTLSGINSMQERIRTVVRENRTWQANSRATWEAMVSMRNAINEYVTMPSIEGDLLQGPENSVFCEAVAAAVISHVRQMQETIDSVCLSAINGKKAHALGAAAAAERIAALEARIDTHMTTTHPAVHQFEAARQRIAQLEVEVSTADYILHDLDPGTRKAMLDALAERRRQIDVEGFDADHDDEHMYGQLAYAAACYANHAAFGEGPEKTPLPPLWSWAASWWKPAPNDPRRDCIKAVALLLAEIERLDRDAERQGELPFD